VDGRGRINNCEMKTTGVASNMKIAYIASVNNCHTAMVRYLRDRGYDVRLLLTNLESSTRFVYHPSHDCFDFSYLDFTTQLDWGNDLQPFFLRSMFSSELKKTVSRDLAEFDILIGGYTAPAYAALAGRKLKMFTCSGGDTKFYPHLYADWRSPFRLGECMEHNLRSYYQKRGIRESEYLWVGELDMDVDRLGYRGQLVHDYLVPTYQPTYEDVLQGKVTKHLYAQEIDRRLLRFNHVFMQPTQHDWNYYGNDRVVRAVKELCRRRDDFGLILVEKGGYIRTRELIRELSVERYVEWFPELPRREFMYLLSSVDGVLGHFSERSIMGGNIVLESIMLGKPVIQHRDDQLYGKVFCDLPPNLEALDEGEIADQMEDVMDNRDKYQSYGKKSKVWYSRMSEKVINRVVKIIES
jgi:glycosyltransferase involved in cell wall biosynthesis